jgi:hypothetical protein
VDYGYPNPDKPELKIEDLKTKKPKRYLIVIFQKSFRKVFNEARFYSYDH